MSVAYIQKDICRTILTRGKRSDFDDHYNDDRDSKQVKNDFCKLTECPEYLDQVSQLVLKHRGKQVPLKIFGGLPLEIGILDDTVLFGREEMQEAWSRLYLQQQVKMAVLGFVDNIPSLALGLQCIVLACSNGSVYVYDNEELHLFAKSLKDLFTDVLPSPPIKSYAYGQFTEPESEEEYLNILQEQGLSKIDESTRVFVESKEKEFCELIDFLGNL
ncbi:uncharacterized protein LOC114664832 [Erpetoichthys calabaricus]|uniref:Uncharacterized LOC114664832 n=1 Tax=Erpetoichthys calabaricus TaxID=27687 RepID=A0A8C4TBF2_ERPCA|nr:uncharacterized protein LOC114664832 [Erpetoichthys calabaricus]